MKNINTSLWKLLGYCSSAKTFLSLKHHIGEEITIQRAWFESLVKYAEKVEQEMAEKESGGEV